LGELMERHKVPFRTDVLSRHTEEARGGLKMFLGPGPVLVIRRLRSLTDGPVAISENAVSLRLCPGLEDLEDTQLIDEPLYRLLEERLDLQLSWAERIFDAVAAERSIAEPLEVPVGTPLLFFEQFTYLVGDKPIERSRAWIRTDRQRLYTTLRRSST
jgi:GntR family transcriptional regulator